MSGQEFGGKQPLEVHVEELKTSLKHSLLIFILLTGLIFYFSDTFLMVLQDDLGLNLHGLTPLEVLNVRIMIALTMGFILSLPAMLHSFYKFAAPGLKEEERNVLKKFMPISYILFLVGAAFSYMAVFKNAVEFLEAFTEGAGVELVWGLQSTMALGLRISLLTGFLFQMPLMIYIGDKSGLISAEKLGKYRPYVYAGILLVAAFATPPDLITQLLITAPVILLFEATILGMKKL